MKLRLSWSPVVHEIAPGLAAALVMVALTASVTAASLWQHAARMQRQSAQLQERAQSLAASQPSRLESQEVPSMAELTALHDRLSIIRRERQDRDWITSDWLDLLASDMPAAARLTALQHGPDLASVLFTVQADDAAALAGWLLHLERSGDIAEVNVLRQDSRVRLGQPVVSMDVRIRR